MDFTQYNQAEFFKPDKIKNLQKALFKRHFNYLAQNSPYYRQKLRKAGVDTKRVEIENLTDLPFTDKSDLEKHNDDFLAVPMLKIKDIVSSSGTTGKPTKVMYTEQDLIRLAYNEETAFRRCGITSEDIVLLACTMDRCFVAGLAYFLGVRNIGAAAIRNGVSNIENHLEIIQRLKPTVIVGVPSFLRKLGLFLKSEDINPVSVHKLVCIGEPIRERNFSLLNIGRELEEIWEAGLFSTYASTEMVTTFCECRQQQGGHFHPALAVVEIVNNEGKVLQFGEIGEVVVTPMFVEGMPLLRFKTGDISFLLEEPCACGRFSYRLGPIMGRKNQMIKFKGTTFYPQTIYSVLDGIPEIEEYYLVISGDSDLSENVEVFVSVRNDFYSANVIMDKLQSCLRVRPKVIIFPQEKIIKQIYPGKARKAIRLIDKRRK